MVAGGKQRSKESNVKVADSGQVRQSVALREYRRGTGVSLDLDPRIDLTKPIYEQVQKLDAQDRTDELQGQATAG